MLEFVLGVLTFAAVVSGFAVYVSYDKTIGVGLLLLAVVLMVVAIGLAASKGLFKNIDDRK